MDGTGEGLYLVNQRQTNTLFYNLNVESKKQNKLMIIPKKKQPHNREQTDQRGKGQCKGQERGDSLRDTNYYV